MVYQISANPIHFTLDWFFYRDYTKHIMMGAILAVFLVLLVPLFLIPATAQDVLIASVESNPEGTDAGYEWITLFNSGEKYIDLSGWRVVTEDGDDYLLHQRIPACDSLTVIFPTQFIDNKDAILELFDASGTKIDVTPSISDTKNDDSIWSVSTPQCGNEISYLAPKPVLPQSSAIPGDILEVTFVDLGRAGESILLIAPGDTAMLIDGGLASSHDRLMRILNDNHVDSIDIMVATHADQDHISGLTSVIQNPNVDVKRVLLSHVGATTKTYEKFQSSIVSLQIPSEIVYAGHTIKLTDSLTARVISPPSQGISDSSSLRNTNSLIIHIEYGAVSFLFTGDATAKTEQWIVRNVSGLDIDIMSGPHHGSRHSSTVSFIDHVTPQLVVFSADVDNRYGHPHPDVISKYDNRRIVNYQTGTDGSVEIRTNGVECSLILIGEKPIPCYDGIATVGSSDMTPENAKIPSTPKTTQTFSIPKWIKETAQLWHQGHITDQQFIDGIQYLIQHKVIIVQLPQDNTFTSSDKIPEWIKTNAKLWTDGHISDEVFMRGIEFLIKHGIIQVTFA